MATVRSAPLGIYDAPPGYTSIFTAPPGQITLVKYFTAGFDSPDENMTFTLYYAPSGGSQAPVFGAGPILGQGTFPLSCFLPMAEGDQLFMYNQGFVDVEGCIFGANLAPYT